MNKKKWYQSNIAIIALLILFFPVGLFLMWKYAGWNKIVKWVITGFFLLILLGSYSDDSSEKDNDNSTSNSEQTTNLSQSPEPEKKTTLSHQEILSIAKENPNSILNETYDMTLYLDQRPTYDLADFMSQADPNSNDTLLIVCRMRSSDIAQLDGESAQNGIYKPYSLIVTFERNDTNDNLIYEAYCVLK